MTLKFGKLAVAFGLATMAIQPLAAQAPAMQDAQAAVTKEGLTVAALAGSWVEPVTEADLGEIQIYGSENMVEIAADGSFSDAVDLRFNFVSDPEISGTYRLTSEGTITIANDTITWAVGSSKATPIIPAGASDEKRAAMQEFAVQIEQEMTNTETYPIVSYDGREMVMNAGGEGLFEEYVMTRR